MQGAGLGLVFTPLQVLAFATLAPNLRTEGAALFSLGRNIGAAIGVSVTTSLLAHNTQALHEEIGASVNPFNRALQALGAARDWLDPATRSWRDACWTRSSITRRRSSPMSTTTC